MKTALLAALFSVLLLTSCQTTQAPLSADTPSEIFFQRAQAATDQSQYDEALTIYRTFLADRPEASREDQFSARYEVALLLAKKGQEAEARAGYEAILADYEDLDKSSGAPAWVKVLTQKKLQEIKDRAPKAKQ